MANVELIIYIFSYTTPCSSFKVFNILFFWVIVYTDTQTDIHTSKLVGILYSAVDKP